MDLLRRYIDHIERHDTEIVVMVCFMVGFYLIARLLHARPIIALAFAFMPVLFVTAMQDPTLKQWFNSWIDAGQRML
ncbi:MAG: hypothetical protein ACO1OK_06355 [Devosia sp.]